MKRITALIVALCIILSLVPATFAGEADATGLKIVYNIGEHMPAYSTTESVPFSSLTYEKTGGLWEYVGNSYGATTTGDNIKWRGPDGIQLIGAGNWFVVKINIPVSGTYRAEAKYAKFKETGGRARVIVLPKTTDYSSFDASVWNNIKNKLYCSPDCRNGTKDNEWSDASGNAHIAESGAKGVYLEAGEYYLGFYYYSTGSNTAFGDFTIYTVDENNNAYETYNSVYTGVVNAEKKKLTVGKKTSVSAVLSDSITHEKVTDAKFTYTSSDTDVLTVDKETGAVTAVGTGKATVSATCANYPGANILSTEITVGEPTESGIKVIYDIGSYMGKWGDTSLLFESLTYDKTHNFWQYAANSAGDETISANFKWRSGNGVQLLNKTWFAIKINVPKGGDYIPKVRYGKYKKDEAFEVYLIEATDNSEKEKVAIEAGMTSENLLGTVKNTTAMEKVTWSDSYIQAFPTEKLNVGEYYLVYKHTDGSNAFAGNFILDGGDGTASMGLSLCIENFCASVETVMSDGSFMPYEGNDVVYSIAPAEGAEIDATTGVISPKELGTVTVTATVGSGESARVLTQSLNITEFEMDCAGVYEQYDFTKISPEWGVAVNPNEDSTKDGDVRNITYKYTGTDGDGNWEYFGIGPENDWKFAPTGFYVYGGDGASARLRISMPEGGKWVALTLKVPKKGKYTASLNYSVYHSSAGASKIYLIPKSTPDINAALTNENLLGTVSYRDKSVSSFTERNVELGNLNLYEEGEYLLVFKLNSGNVSSYLTPRKFILNGENSVRRVNATADVTTLGFEDYAQISVSPVRLDGSVLKEDECEVTYKSLDIQTATVDENGKVFAFGDGEVGVEVTVDDGMNAITETVVFNVVDDTGVRETVLKIPEKLYIGEKAKLQWYAIMNSGNLVAIPVDTISHTLSADSVVEVADGFITGLTEGAVDVSVSAQFRGELLNTITSVSVISDSGKREPTYYTYDRRENAKENISKYDWAKDEAESVIDSADRVVENLDMLYNGIIGEGVPRGRQIGAKDDPMYNFCRYCGENIVGKYGANGTGGWTADNFTRPWKVQCPDCKRIFPSNDFESFLKLGLDAQGYFDLDRAYEKHKELFAEEYEASGYAEKGYGYLKNDLYPELYNPNSESYNLDPLQKVWVDGKLWGVDDSMGYVPLDKNGEQRVYSNGVKERHGYVGLYNYKAWSALKGYIEDLTLAYVYTDDEKYGRTGAILLDRIADVYESFDIYPYRGTFWNTHGGSGYGSIQGRINDCDIAATFALGADAFYPMLDDSDVIDFLSIKAKEMGLENEKTSSKQIWENWAKGILRHTFTMSKDGRIYGNYGQQQNALAIAAVVLDNEPESQEMIEWIYRTGDLQTGGSVSGGNLESQLVDVVDRDGYGDEGSPYYNVIWSDRLLTMAETLALYKGKNNYNPFAHPKFAQMFRAPTRAVSVDTHHTQIGDAGAVAGIGFHGNAATALRGFMYLKDTAIGYDLAKYVYIRNQYNVDGLHYGIFDENPERAEEEIISFISSPSEQESDMMTGFGFATLRAGRNYLADTSATAKNTLRDFWMYFGGAGTSHGHRDTLNLGVEAYGLNLAPEMAYPENTGSDPNRSQWVSATVSHNTVLVDERNQDTNSFFGTPLHFDDAGKVKIMDIDGNGAYNNTENYRRTVVMIEASDEVSYGVDFFRVTGGNKHTYSFHAQSENATPAEGLEMVAQENSETTYAAVRSGDDVAYGSDPGGNDNTTYPRGYTWMRKVRQDKAPEKNFAVDFEIRDYRKAIKDSKGLRLRMTQMNDFVPDEVAIVGGMVPVKTANAAMPEMLEYVLVQREGENLDSMFTTVIEPYKNDRYIQGIEPVEVTGEVQNGEMVRAVRVTHTNGRTDYIVYATDNTKTYRVADLFDFRGFVGVYSVNSDGAVIYRYVNDGDIIGSATDKPVAYTGTVDAFTNELSFENYIDVNMVCENVSDLVGRHIYINNDGVQNGVYRIEGAEEIEPGKIRLDIGTISPIRGHKDPENIDKGYIYNIRQEQAFSIPTSFVDESLPEFDEINDNITTSAGSSVSVKVTAHSPITENAPTIEYVAQTLPRGASLDSKTGVITWKPDASQIGGSHFAITARDSDGRESTIHFTITVYGSTTSKPSDKTENSGNVGTTDTPAGGGGGGGGAAPTDKPEDTTNTEQTDTSGESGEGEKNEGNTDNTGTEINSLRFTDLDNHSWAADAINTLASDGVIKGTSATTFAPANNITRADFALILVRAFGLTSDNAENFADVSAGDYFATELAIARNSGIISGIGDNKYAPRNTITRQDMMVIVYRALQKLNVEFGIYDEPQHSDFTAVAEYAKDAVSTLVSAGLVNGKNSLIAPTDYTTRAEVAVLIKRILDFKSAKK